MSAKWAIAAALFVIVGGRLAAAEDILAGLPADEYWRHRREFAELMPKAIAGDPVAQDRIGAFYDYGFVGQDYDLAALWYRRAAQQGNADAEYNLAILYLNGLGVKEDDREGVALLRAAAARGHMMAKRLLGDALINGYYSLPVDEKAGWSLIYEAAEAGNVRAQMLWGTHLQSPERRTWLERAARFGDPDALLALALESEKAHGGLSNMLAIAQAGSTFAMGMVACAAFEASHTDTERRNGLRWLGMAIDQGDPNASLGIVVLDGRHLIRLSPVHRAFLYAVLFDQGARLTPVEDGEERHIPYFVAAIFNLPPDLRDQARQLRSDYGQRRITFDDLQIVPNPFAPAQDWVKGCQLMDNK